MTVRAARRVASLKPSREQLVEALRAMATHTGYAVRVASGALLSWIVLCGLVLAHGMALLLVGLPLRRRLEATLDRNVAAELHRACRYLGLSAQSASRFSGGYWIKVGWSGVNAVIGLGIGLLVLVLATGIAVSFTCPLWWWLLPPELAVTPGGYPVDSWPSALLTPLVGLVYLALYVSLVPKAARGHARLARRMLLHADKNGLLSRITEVTASRQEALEAHGTELRRIERDLHDGTQSRLVAVHMHLGIIERLLTDDPQRARELIAVTKDAAEEALSELRGVVRSIYPPILADRGLTSAVKSLAARSAVPCTVEVGELGSLPTAVEAAAYFVVTESLTNAAKHAAATEIGIRIGAEDEALLITVTDDGHGGADENAGSGLAGIRRRVAAFDGQARITSPHGGPTTIEVRMPCVF
ncbi:sensor histidine kinase [Salinactinospora qingdaonensis]|uniref:histidine kinase n=1 Tax=Salinactinospora qingdaonensis TaxID=702744 RepID=A0ABP7G4J9_9ACTN